MNHYERAEALALFDRGLELKEKAYVAGSFSLMEEAVSVFVELEQRFARARGAPFEELVAKSRYNRAGALGALGHINEAAACFAAVAAQYGDSDDAELRETAKFAAARERMMLAVPAPPPYVVEHPQEQSMLADPEILADPELVARTRARQEARVNAAVESHRRAQAILLNYQVKAMPFVLFLRSFDVEAFSRTTEPAFSAETGLEQQAITFAAVQPGRIEEEVARTLEGHTTAVAVANRASLFESALRIPRLFLPDDGWQEVVGQVVRAAEVIVVQVEELTPGVLWELDCIRTHGRSPPRSSCWHVLSATNETERCGKASSSSRRSNEAACRPRRKRRSSRASSACSLRTRSRKRG